MKVMKDIKAIARTTLIILVVAIIVIAGVGIGAYIVMNPTATPTPVATATPTATATATATPTATPTPTAEQVTITVWHGDTESVARITQELIEEEFYKLYPNIRVNYELAPEPFQQKLLITVAAGTGPDLFEWNHDWIGTLAEADILEPIDNLVTADLSAKYVKSALDAGRYEGKLYTLPISAEVGAFAYNVNLLGNNPVPENTDALVALMAAAKENGLYGIGYPQVPYLVSGFIHAYGGWLWDDAAKTLGVNSPGTKAAMKWIMETFGPYMSEDVSWDPQCALFSENKSLFAINGPWMVGTWRDAGINFGVTTIPEVSEIGVKPRPYTGVKSIYMTKNVRNRDAAFVFMEWSTTSRERILRRATELGYIPVLKEVLDLPEIANNPVISGFAEQVKLGIPMSSSPEMVAVWGPFQDALNAMWGGVKSVDQALDDAQAQIIEAIREMGT